MAKQDSVASPDGTTIVFDRLGDGPLVVIIGAGPIDSTANAAVAELLSAHFTVYNYDRRARGLAVTKLAAWEPPYFLNDEPHRPPADYHDQLAAAVAAGRPGAAVDEPHRRRGRTAGTHRPAPHPARPAAQRRPCRHHPVLVDFFAA